MAGGELDRRRITPRQLQILELIAAGLSDKQIATRLRVSPRTVQAHLDRFYNAQGVHTRAQAVAVLLGLKQERSLRIDT